MKKRQPITGKIDACFGICLSILCLLLSIGWTAAQSTDSENIIASYDDLITRYLDYREHNYKLAVPSWYLSTDQVEEIDSQYGLAGFQNQPDWYVNFNMGELMIEPNSPLAAQAGDGTRLILYEDMTKGELLIIQDAGATFKTETSYKSPKWPKENQSEAIATYLTRELSKRRVVWHVVLRDEASAQVNAQAALAPVSFGGSEMLLLMGGESDSNIVITAIEPNEPTLTLAYPVDFTNRLDIFTCIDLLPHTWTFAARDLTTEGTNPLVWAETNQWLQGVSDFRLYTAGNADLDSDGDGYADAREQMVYLTDPMSSNSRPSTVSGILYYSASETGTIHILAVTNESSWSLAKSVSIPAPGSYTNDELGNHVAYWFKAFMDVDGNGRQQEWEPSGQYRTYSTLVTGDLLGINFPLKDQPSIWGTVSYSGSQTGDVYVIAVKQSNSWSTTYKTVLSWEQGVADPTGGVTYLSFPSDYSITDLPSKPYWIKAFIDVDGNGAFTSGDVGGQVTNTARTISNRVTDIAIILDGDSDGDGMADWWEWQFFGDLSAGVDTDTDNDTLDNLTEYLLGTNPTSPDSDEDFFGDSFEVEQAYDPLDDNSRPKYAMTINSNHIYLSGTQLNVEMCSGLVAQTYSYAFNPTMTGAVTNAFAISFSVNHSFTNSDFYALYVVLRGSDGNESLPIAFPFIVDNDPPVIESIFPPSGYGTNNAIISLQGTVSDRIGDVAVFVNSNRVDGIRDWGFISADLFLDEGTNIVTVEARDRAGFTTKTQIVLYVTYDGDTVAPSANFLLPHDYEISGATTSWYDTTTFCNESNVYIWGNCDADVHALLLSSQDAAQQMLYTGSVIRIETQWYGYISLAPGTNVLSLLAKDSAGNSSTNTAVVVRDTGCVFRITSPEPFAEYSSPMLYVYGEVSPQMTNATIAVGGVSLNWRFETNDIVYFETVSPIELSVGLNRILGEACLNNRSYYADPPYSAYQESAWENQEESYTYQELGNSSFIYSHFTGREIWNAPSPTFTSILNVGESHTCIDLGFLGILHVDEPTDYAEADFSIYSHSGFIYAGSYSSTSLYLALEYTTHYPSSSRNVTKFAMETNLQSVFMHFEPFALGGLPVTDPRASNLASQITFKGSPLIFLTNGTAGFVTQILPNKEYIINSSDFTWPYHSMADGFLYNGNLLGIGHVENHTLSVESIRLYPAAKPANRITRPPELSDNARGDADYEDLHVVGLSWDATYTPISFECAFTPSDAGSLILWSVDVHRGSVSVDHGDFSLSSEGYFGYSPGAVPHSHQDSDVTFNVGLDLDGDHLLSPSEVMHDIDLRFISPAEYDYCYSSFLPHAAGAWVVNLPDASHHSLIFLDAISGPNPTSRTLSFSEPTYSGANGQANGHGTMPSSINDATIPHYRKDSGSGLSMRILADDGFWNQILAPTIQAMNIDSYYAANPSVTNHVFTSNFDESGISMTSLNLNLALGKARYVIPISIQTERGSDGYARITGMSFSGYVDDLYDFRTHGGDEDNGWASRLQVGYATASGQDAGAIYWLTADLELLNFQVIRRPDELDLMKFEYQFYLSTL